MIPQSEYSLLSEHCETGPRRRMFSRRHLLLLAVVFLGECSSTPRCVAFGSVPNCSLLSWLWAIPWWPNCLRLFCKTELWARSHNFFLSDLGTCKHSSAKETVFVSLFWVDQEDFFHHQGLNFLCHFFQINEQPNKKQLEVHCGWGVINCCGFFFKLSFLNILCWLLTLYICCFPF